jgi:hypothetical protein
MTPSSYCLPKLVFSLCSARDWKKQHARFHFPTFYNFIVDTFEDPKGEAAEETIDKLLKWWNGYVQVQYMKSEVLISPLLFSKVFPATTGEVDVVVSRRVMQQDRKRLQEACARRALDGMAGDLE